MLGKAQKKMTALMIAVYNNRVKVIDKLLHGGANSEMLELVQGEHYVTLPAQGHDSIKMLDTMHVASTQSKLDRMTPYGLATKNWTRKCCNTLREAKVK